MMKNLFKIFLVLLLSSCSLNQDKPVLRIGLVADPQFEDRNTAGKRHYRESLWKLEEAIDTFNFYKVDLVQNLGDIINRKWESYNSIIPVYKKLDEGIMSYHLFGNHDFAIDSVEMTSLLETLGMDDHYYSYERENFRFIVLNSMDYSFLGNPLYNRDTNKINNYFKSTMGYPNHFIWNGAVGDKQQAWLKSELKAAEQEGQKVIVFEHMPLLPEDVEERLWNADEIIKILESSPNVLAHINGHRHKGGYAYENGIHYISVFGMVDTEISSYGILEFYKDRIELKGFGHQESFILN